MVSNDLAKLIHFQLFGPIGDSPLAQNYITYISYFIIYK